MKKISTLAIMPAHHWAESWPESWPASWPASSPASRAARLFVLASLLLIGGFIAFAAHAQQAMKQEGPRQDIAALKSLAEAFLLAQAANLPGTASVKLKDPDPRLNLPACAAPETWMPQGSKALGKTSVGIRCAQPAWNLLLPATVSVTSAYVTSAAPLAQGQKLGAGDLVLRQGDLASLPAGVLTDLAQAQGRTLQMPLAAGMPVSRAQLKSPPVVQQGQPVRLVASGNGFSVSGEGRALTSGAEGDLVQARTASGQLVAGVAQADGVLSVRY